MSALLFSLPCREQVLEGRSVTRKSHKIECFCFLTKYALIECVYVCKEYNLTNVNPIISMTRFRLIT